MLPLMLVFGSLWGATGAAGAVARVDRRLRVAWAVMLSRLRRDEPRAAHADRSRGAVKVLIVTGIWPPDVGGPASHAPEVAEFLRGRGHEVERRRHRRRRAGAAAVPGALGLAADPAGRAPHRGALGSPAAPARPRSSTRPGCSAAPRSAPRSRAAARRQADRGPALRAGAPVGPGSRRPRWSSSGARAARDLLRRVRDHVARPGRPRRLPERVPARARARLGARPGARHGAAESRPAPPISRPARSCGGGSGSTGRRSSSPDGSRRRSRSRSGSRRSRPPPGSSSSDRATAPERAALEARAAGLPRPLPRPAAAARGARAAPRAATRRCSPRLGELPAHASSRRSRSARR